LGIGLAILDVGVDVCPADTVDKLIDGRVVGVSVCPPELLNTFRDVPGCIPLLVVDDPIVEEPPDCGLCVDCPELLLVVAVNWFAI